MEEEGEEGRRIKDSLLSAKTPRCRSTRYIPKLTIRMKIYRIRGRKGSKGARLTAITNQQAGDIRFTQRQRHIQSS